ncbi:hypothetical protein AB9F43_33150, partial [Rhizobium leguminosarum]
MTLSYGSLSIAQLSTLIQCGSADPVTVAEQVLDAIESHDDLQPGERTATGRRRHGSAHRGIDPDGILHRAAER